MEKDIALHVKSFKKDHCYSDFGQNILSGSPFMKYIYVRLGEQKYCGEGEVLKIS